MAIDFYNPVTAGVVLVREAIQSQNYQPGVDGWTIDADGHAEFNDITIRGGTVIGGTALYYDGTPALGNLIMSISADAGTDSFGNAYVSGVGVYGDNDTVTALSVTGDQVQLRADATSYVADSTSPGLQFTKATETGAGASITEYDDTFDRGLALASPSDVAGGSSPEDFAFIQMIGKFSTVSQIALSATNINMVTDEVLATGTIISRPQSSTAVGIIADNPSGTTADLLALRVDGDSKFTVDESGILQTYADNDFPTFVPTVNNGGTVTWTTRTGWYQKLGKMTFFNVKLVVNANGSGAGPVQVVLPFTMNASIDQEVLVRWQETRIGYAVLFAGANSATFDRIRAQDGGATNQVVNITGADLLTGRTLTIQGWVREA